MSDGLASPPTSPGAAPVRAASSRRVLFACGLALLAALAVRLAPSMSPAVQFANRDGARFAYPLKKLVAEELAQGRLPTWNAWVAAGEPLLGALGPGVLDPLGLLPAAVGVPLGFQLMHWLCLAAAVLGAFAWVRRLWGDDLAAVAGAAGFGLGGYVAGISDNWLYLRSLAAAPLLLLALDVAVVRGRARDVGLGALALALATAGGDPQAPALVLLAGGAVSVWRAREEGQARIALGRAAAVAGLGGLLAAPVLLPGILTFLASDRAGGAPSAGPVAWAFHPLRLPELVVPGLLAPPRPDLADNPVYRALFGDAGRALPWVPSEYAGAAVLALAAFGAARREARPFLVVAAVAGWLSFGPALGASQLGALVPVWRSFQYPEKLLPLALLFLAPVAALGVRRVVAEPGARRGAGRGLGVAAALAAGGAAIAAADGASCAGWLGLPPAAGAVLAENLAAGLLHTAVALAAVAGALVAPGLAARGRAAALAAVCLVDVCVGVGLSPALHAVSAVDASGPLPAWLRAHDPTARILTPFELPEQGGPPSIEAQLTLLTRTLHPLANLGERVPSFSWYGSLAPGRYRALQEAAVAAGRSVEVGATFGAGYVVVPGSLENLGRVGVQPPWDVVAVDGRVPASLVRVPHRPHAYLAERVREAPVADALREVLAPGFAATGLVLLEAAGVATPDGPPCEVPGSDALEEQRPRAERIELRVRAACPRWLVVNEEPAPGWTVTLDGAPVEPVRANVLAQAVLVPPGAHAVVLAYTAPGLAEGAGLALASLLALSLLAIRERARGSRPGG